MTNDTEIARVLALQEKATAGPWATVGRSHDHIIICEKWRHVKLADVHSYLHPYGPSAEDRESNAAFIAAAHDMANLIRALRDERDALKKDAALLHAMNDACLKLPGWWTISFEVSGNSGSINLCDPEGNTLSADDYGSVDSTLAEQVGEALAYALEHVAPSAAEAGA